MVSPTRESRWRARRHALLVFREAGYATWSSSANDFTGQMTNLHQGVEVLHEAGSVVLPEGLGFSKNAQTFADRLLPWLE